MIVMKCGENVMTWKLACVLFALALIFCIGTMPTKVEANGVENIKLEDTALDF